MSKLADYLQLMRATLLPTAWSNVLAGIALSVLPDGPGSLLNLGLLLVCSSCLYIGGMVLNDFFDYKLDSIERPERVLPSGRISRKQAGILGFSLLGLALILAAFVSLERGKNGFPVVGNATIAVVIVLVTLILFYNMRAKHFMVGGPVVMGLCRAFNVLLGCSLTTTSFDQAQLFVAGSIGLYVAGITFFAKEEQGISSRRFLITGVILMAVAIGLLLYFPFTEIFWLNYQLRHMASPGNREFLFVGLLAMMVFPVARKVLVATLTRQSGDVKQAVVTSLLTIIMIDASICYLASPSTPAYALGVAILIVPAYLLSRRILAT